MTFESQLQYLKLSHLSRHHEELTADAAKQRWSHAQFLRRIVEAEAHDRQQHALLSRVTEFPEDGSGFGQGGSDSGLKDRVWSVAGVGGKRVA